MRIITIITILSISLLMNGCFTQRVHKRLEGRRAIIGKTLVVEQSGDTMTAGVNLLKMGPLRQEFKTDFWGTLFDIGVDIGSRGVIGYGTYRAIDWAVDKANESSQDTVINKPKQSGKSQAQIEATKKGNTQQQNQAPAFQIIASENVTINYNSAE